MVVLRPNSDNDSLPSLCLLPYPIFPEPVVANDKRFMRKIETNRIGVKEEEKGGLFSAHEPTRGRRPSRRALGAHSYHSPCGNRISLSLSLSLFLGAFPMLACPEPVLVK
jgi:hypothetical protein